MSEILLISLAVLSVAVLLGALARRLGDLDDIGNLRDMVDRS